jgi:hypothetical protein
MLNTNIYKGGADPEFSNLYVSTYASKLTHIIEDKSMNMDRVVQAIDLKIA